MSINYVHDRVEPEEYYKYNRCNKKTELTCDMCHYISTKYAVVKSISWGRNDYRYCEDCYKIYQEEET